MKITAIYAALLTPLFILLSLRVIAARRVARSAIGDGNDASLLRRMRVQANFAEYVPMALVLMALAESMRGPAWLLHVLGMALLAARMSHAYGVSQEDENFRFRVFGVGVTFTMLSIAAATCLVLAVASSS